MSLPAFGFFLGRRRGPLSEGAAACLSLLRAGLAREAGRGPAPIGAVSQADVYPEARMARLVSDWPAGNAIAGAESALQVILAAAFSDIVRCSPSTAPMAQEASYE